jgi:hypothetical protein
MPLPATRQTVAGLCRTFPDIIPAPSRFTSAAVYRAVMLTVASELARAPMRVPGRWCAAVADIDRYVAIDRWRHRLGCKTLAPETTPVSISFVVGRFRYNPHGHSPDAGQLSVSGTSIECSFMAYGNAPNIDAEKSLPYAPVVWTPAYRERDKTSPNHRY